LEKFLLNNYQCIKQLVHLTKYDNTSENRFWFGTVLKK
jgi:hypothetical protein